MKLLYIANVGLPDSWAHTIQIMKMCEAFSDASVEVELLVPKRKTEIKADIFEYYGLKEKFKITRIPCVNLSHTSSSAFVYYTRLISFVLALKIYLLFKKSDILYTRDNFIAFFLKECVFEIHSLPRAINWLNRRVWAKAKALVVLTSLIKESLIRQGVNQVKILVAGDAVKIEEFAVNDSKEDARKELGLPKEGNLIGYVGSLKTMSMEKGVGASIMSLKYLDDSCKLCVVGGEEKDIDFYKEFAKKQNLLGRVIFTGNVKHNKVPLYMKAMDVLVAPFPANDHYSFYMSPLKIFEYMASGRPIVASNLPSIREVLNQENSILITPADERELAGAIRKLTEDKNFSDKISGTALQNVQNYTWQKRAKNILVFCDKK